jgi:septum formation protein
LQRLILGSQSPRRYEILSYFSLPFEQISSEFDEDSVPFNGDPLAYAQKIAIGKALSLSAKYPEAVILTADTVVFKEGRIYGKPKNEAEAFKTLSELSGKWHSVITAIALWTNGRLRQGSEETRVLFNPLTEIQIQRYLEALHWADKAGGYAIQLAGSLLVRRIEGCYYNVVGLPVHVVSSLLKEEGIDLWDYLK